MARYIDADAFLERMKRTLRYFDVKFDIEEMPTADVVEVVRCKDCKHNVANWQHDELDCTDYTDITCDYFMTDGINGNDFCSYGERIEK